MRRNTVIALGVCVTFALVMTGELSAATYYVDPSGSNGNDGSSPATAWKTIQQAADVLGAGDTVYIGDGTYYESVYFNRDGTAANPIRFVAESAGNVIVKKSENRVFYLNSASYVQFDGLTIRGDLEDYEAVRIRDGVGIVFTNCDISGFGDELEDDLFDIQDSEITVIGCKVHNAGDQAFEIRSSTTLLVQASEIYGAAEDGFHTNGSSTNATITIERSHIYNNRRRGIRAEGIDLQIRNCLISGNGDGSSGEGIYVDSNLSCLVEHCTIVNNTRYGVRANGGGSATLRNSIIAFNGSYGLKAQNGATFSSSTDYNLLYANGSANYSGVTPGADDIVADPTFIGGGDYHLQAGSPAIDTGTGAMPVDLEGKSRPQGAGVDRGCYEVGSSIYYVRTSGDDSNLGTSPAHAFQSLGKAASAVYAGGIVYVGAGTYAESATLTRSGTALEPIQFIADTTGANTGDAGNVILTPTAANGVVCALSSSNYVTFSGFTLSGGGFSGARGMVLSSSLSVTFEDCDFSDLEYGIHGTASAMFVTSSNFSNNSYALYSTQGGISLADSTFLQNTSGSYSNQDLIFLASNCQFSDGGTGVVIAVNDTWSTTGATAPVRTVISSDSSLKHAKLTDCALEENTIGMRLVGYTDTLDIEFATTTNENNTSYGWELYDCALSFTSSNWGDWPLGANGAGIYGSNSDLAFQDITLQNFSNGFALECDGGDIDMLQCTVQLNADGAKASGGTFDASSTLFIDNLGTGLHLGSPAQLSGCTMDGNGIGLQLDGLALGEFQALSSTMRDNTQYGVYLENTQLTLTASQQAHWTISGNAVGIHGTGSDLRLEYFNVSANTLYGVSSDTGSLRVTGCEIDNNGNGLYAVNNTLVEISGATISNNTNFGLHLGGNATVSDCTIEANGSGILFEDTDISHTTTLSDNTIVNNTTVGIYASQSTMTFNTTLLGGTTISGSNTVFAGFESDLTFDGLTVSGGSLYGIANYDGTMAVNNCTVTGNGTGLHSEDGCSATGTTFTGNTTAGVSVLAGGGSTFTNCIIENNPHGLTITGDTTGLVTLDGSQIRDNTLYGVWCDSCNLTFDATMQAGWSVQNNGSNFGATGSTLTFDGFTISNGTTYGVVSENGTLNLTNCTLTANGTGAYVAADSTLNATGTTFTSNTLYGASIQGTATLDTCAFTSNTNGLQLANVTAGTLSCSDTTISNNSLDGLHLESCTLTLTGSGISGLTISGNGYGIHGTNSTLTFDGFTTESNTYGVWLTASDATISNSTFTNCTYGLWSQNNTAFEATNSSFTGNTSYGVYLEGAGNFVDCSITNNGDGLFATANLTDTNLSGTTISDNPGKGIYLDGGSLNLSAQASENWTIARNGYNIFAYDSSVMLASASLLDATNYGIYAQLGSLALTGSTVTTQGHGVWALNTTGFTIERSRVSGASGANWAVVNYDGNLDLRNSVVSSASYGVYSSSPSTSTTIYNSTIADVSDYGVYADQGNVTVMNTIIAGTSGTNGLYQGASASVTHTHNLIYGFTDAFFNTTADPTEVFREPRFVDGANGDFRLAKGSPAINAGTDLTVAAPYDLLNNPRPSHKVFEIGAYEFTSDDGSFRVLQWEEKK